MPHQAYDVYVEMEHVVLGNDALFKCKIPSYVADLTEVVGWVDSEGKEYLPSTFGNLPNLLLLLTSSCLDY